MSATDKLIKRIGYLEVELYKLQLDHQSGYTLRKKIDTMEAQHKSEVGRLKGELELLREVIEDQKKAIKELKGEI